MRQEQIEIHTMQQIIYPDTQQVDRFEQQTQGMLLELVSYSKVKYTDAQGATVELKWTPKQAEQIEIKMPQYTLKLNTKHTSILNYPTPQGIWELAVVATNIEWQRDLEQTAGKQQVQLVAEYYIRKQEEILANYQFRLIYLV